MSRKILRLHLLQYARKKRRAGGEGSGHELGSSQLAGSLTASVDLCILSKSLRMPSKPCCGSCSCLHPFPLCWDGVRILSPSDSPLTLLAGACMLTPAP